MTEEGLEKMTYAELMDRCDECTRIASEKLRSGQLDLAIFYRNCAEGYRLRALALYVN